MDILCLGILIADLVAKTVRRLPKKGKLELVDQIELHSGGCAANTAIDLAKLGLKIGLAGKIGQDSLGDSLLKIYKKYDLNIQGISRTDKTHTSTTVVMVDQQGERSFLHALGANAQFSLRDIDLFSLSRYQIVHLAGSLLLPKFDGQPAAQFFREVKKRNLITSLDVVWDAQGRWLNLLKPVLPYTDIFLPNFEEAKMITGEQTPEKITDQLLDLGVKIVALKMGEKGCYVSDGKEIIAWPAHQIEPVDTTGAGDAFVAGFLFGIVKGWTLTKITSFATGVGAMACLSMGASTGVSSAKKTLQFIKKTPLKKT